MSYINTSRNIPSALALAISASLLLSIPAHAQEQTENKPATSLDKVVVTGSLIPQTQVETFVPLTVITAQDITANGFTSIAEAVQKSAFATGGVQNNQSSGAFTQGAETLSMFGLSSSYVKYLVDGRPMANYPALYNGSNVINTLSGIPVTLVERIEILPGGQSSLYGSDAIAGVVNVILKKDAKDQFTLYGRIGGYEEGGGQSGRLGFSTAIESENGKWYTLIGAQMEKSNPIWGYQRDLTHQYNTHAYAGEAALASRDWLIYDTQNLNSYLFFDPANCNNLIAGYDGTVQKHTRPGKGDYCGSLTSSGYRTLKNAKQGGQVYINSSFDLSDTKRLYANVLLNSESIRYHQGPLMWGSDEKWGMFYDANVGSLLNLQRLVTPEEMGGMSTTESTDKTTAYAVNFGISGTFGSDSFWDYDIGYSRTQYNLTESKRSLLADAANAYFQAKVLGPQLSLDPLFNAYPVFAPNYAEFYKLLPAADFASITAITNSHSKTSDSMLRLQLTNSALFSLPGGDAGMAIALETGSQNWRYAPDVLLSGNKIWGTRAVSGSGHRSRYALTTEFRLPLFDQLTLSTSGRYDAYRVAGNTISKPTYSLGLEYRPAEAFLLRGKYSTAFKAPTLADQFQGNSGFFGSTTDYYNCALLGFNAGNISNCPSAYADLSFEGEQTGNTALKPINAKVWSYGLVWAPTTNFSASADYHHWTIRNEVSPQSVDQLMRDEAQCRLNTLPATSGTCIAALSQVTRAPDGSVQKIVLKKINIAQETLNAVAVSASYRYDLGSNGTLNFGGAWTRNLKHEFQPYPTDAVHDSLNDPYYSADPKYKATATAGWNRDRWATTLYFNYMGPTPNYRATLDPSGYALAGAGRLGSYTTTNLSVNYQMRDNLQLSLIVNNLTNRMPTMDQTSYPGYSGAPYNSANFDLLGRAFFLEARWGLGGK